MGVYHNALYLDPYFFLLCGRISEVFEGRKTVLYADDLTVYDKKIVTPLFARSKKRLSVVEQ